MQRKVKNNFATEDTALTYFWKITDTFLNKYQYI